jgi:hypothetical protein
MLFLNKIRMARMPLIFFTVLGKIIRNYVENSANEPLIFLSHYFIFEYDDKINYFKSNSIVDSVHYSTIIYGSREIVGKG